MFKYLKQTDKLTGKAISANHFSRAAKKLEEKFPVTTEQRSLLAYGAVLPIQNGESARILHIKASTDEVKDMLEYNWGIKGRAEALPIIDVLARAANHTEFADDIFNVYVKNANLGPLHEKDVQGNKGLANAFNSIAKGNFDIKQLPKNMPKEAKASFFGLVEMELAARANLGLRAFKSARDTLLEVGMTDEELSTVHSTAAWDLGCAASIARYCAYMDYITEDEAWEFMRTVAKNAAPLYKNRREWIAGYVIGRALGYGDDSKSEQSVLDFLLNDDRTLFNCA